MAINVPLMQATMDYITDHPTEWDQAVWRRVTLGSAVACFAGTACWLNGDTFGTGAIAGSSCDEVIHPDGSVESIGSRARDILGLDQSEADRLFNATNDLDDLDEIVDGLCAA